MPTQPLPADPSLVQLRKQARELQRRLRSRDSAALAQFSEFCPALDLGPAPLHLAQLLLARRFGLSSWPRLVEQVELIREFRRAPDEDPIPDEPAAQFLAHAVLQYAEGDGPARWAVARRLLIENPGLSELDVYTASACADHLAVQRFLIDSPDLATAAGGPFRWPPLMYLAYARHDPDVPVGDVLTTAELLLQAGADPNAGYLWHGLTCPFTVLTGVFGAGEQGPGKQPHHPHATALARLLLEAGADPNDGQALYNRMFESDNRYLQTLFDYGLGAGDGGPWHRRLPELTDSPERMLRVQLGWAIGHGMADRVRLLAEHGVDLNTPDSWHGTAQMSPLALAALTGRPEIARVLVDLGATDAELDPEAALVGALLSGDAAVVAAASPDQLEAVRRRHPSLVLRAAVVGSTAGINLLLDNGFHIDALGRQDIPVEQEWESALHFAAGENDVELVAILLAAGADPTVLDRRFEMTPLGWAEHFGHQDVINVLGPLEQR